jgi:hypothetical protein
MNGKAREMVGGGEVITHGAERLVLACSLEPAEHQLEIAEDPKRAPDDRLDIVVLELTQLCRESALEFALRAGGIVVRHFYDGDLGAWRDRGPKLHSFRTLAQHPNLPMSAGALYRCVAVYELCERLGAIARWRRLGLSHFRSVLSVGEAAQEELLTTANTERWSVKTLHRAAMEARFVRPSRGGRKAQPGLLRSLAKIHASLTSCEVDLAGDLSVNDIEKSKELLRDAKQKLLTLERDLTRRRASS